VILANIFFASLKFDAVPPLATGSPSFVNFSLRIALLSSHDALLTARAGSGMPSYLLAQSSAFEGEGFLANQLRSGAIADSIALSALPFAAAPLTSMAGRASHFRVLQDSAIPAPSSSVQTQQDPQSSQDSQEDDSQGAQVNLAQSARQSGIMMADDILIAVTRSARPLDTEGIALGLSRAL
jgi:hypothetical protein